MFSPSKKEDKKYLLQIGDTILDVAKIGTEQAINVAEQLGNLYKDIEHRIATKDYTQDDYYLERLEKLCQPSTHATPTKSDTTPYTRTT